MSDKALQKMEPGTIARPEPDPRGAVDIGELLRYAVDKGVTTEAMNGLMAIRRELNAEAAKKAFDEALAKFQSACPIIIKDKAVFNKGSTTIRYKYAPLDSIVAQVKALLEQHGFSYTLNAEVKDKQVKAICRIKHAAGHEQFSEMEVPIDPEGYMNVQQKYASALTFAKRYAFCNGFGILTGDEDTDGASKKPQQAGPSAIAGELSVKDLTNELWATLKPVRGTEQSWKAANQWLWDEAVISDTEEAPKLTPARFREVITKAKEKLKK